MPESNPSRQYDAFVMLDTMIELQKRVVGSMDRMSTRIQDMTGEMDRMSRVQVQIRSDVVSHIATLRGDIEGLQSRVNDLSARVDGLRAEMLSRFDAVGARFDDTDRHLERIERDLRETRIEVVAQNNDTLNAVQGSLHVRVRIDELADRLDAIERRQPE